jgi:hypothetical protein
MIDVGYKDRDEEDVYVGDVGEDGAREVGDAGYSDVDGDVRIKEEEEEEEILSLSLLTSLLSGSLNEVFCRNLGFGGVVERDVVAEAGEGERVHGVGLPDWRWGVKGGVDAKVEPVRSTATRGGLRPDIAVGDVGLCSEWVLGGK